MNRMMKLLNDMKGLEGQPLPSTVPGQEPNTSDYFRLQGQLKNIPAQPIKRPLVSKPAASSASPIFPPIQKRSGRPPTPTSFQEAIQQGADIEKRLNEFKEKVKQDMLKALKWGDEDEIKEADYRDQHHRQLTGRKPIL